MKLVKEKTDDNKMKNGSKSKGKPDLKIKKEVKVVVEKINKKLEVKNKKSKNIENSHQVEQYNNELIMVRLYIRYTLHVYFLYLTIVFNFRMISPIQIK